MKRLALGLSTAALVLAVAAAARGHGGAYRGPGTSIPPGSGAPGQTATPGPVVPGGGAGPVTGGGGGARTGARRQAPRDYTGWETWWEFNKQPYLDLRARLGSRFAVTGPGTSGTAASPRPSFAELEPEVLPLLKSLLGESDPDIVDSAVLALARVTPAAAANQVQDDISKALRHPERSVKQSAILALGVLGARDAAPLLAEIAADSADGRKLLGVSQAVDEMQRSLAVVSLGLLSAGASAPAIQRLLERAPDSDQDLKASAALALGLFEADPFDSVRFLLEALDDGRLPDLVRAQVPVALGRLGEAARPAVPALLGVVRSRKTPDLVRQSCVVALGRLAAAEDDEIRVELLRQADKAGDRATQNFALVALGELGARAAAEGVRHQEFLDELGRVLQRQLVRGNRKTATPYAATACALLGRALPATSDLREQLAARLMTAFDEEGNPSHRSAIAVALGLMEARAAGPRLLAALEEGGDLSFQRHLAEALGLMRHEAAKPALLERLADDRDPMLRVALATGLGLMGDLEVSGRLVKELERSGSLYEIAAVARALGAVGDRSALPALIELAGKKSRPSLARAFAAVALGLIGEKSALPWNARLTAGANYIAAFSTQAEVMDIL